MSQPCYYNSTFTYTPELFGHPHETFEQDSTTAFWQQHPEWTNPTKAVGNNTFYHQLQPYPSYDKVMMEENTVVIGYNTRNGRPINDADNTSNPGQKAQPKKKGDGKVEVSAGGIFLRQMPFKVLVRFSKAAATAFPKPNKSDAVNGGNDGAAKKGKTTDWAEDDGAAPDLAADIAKLKLEDTTTSATRPGPGQINFYLDTLWLQPPKEAYEFAFQWMHEAKNAGHGDNVLTYATPKPEVLSLEKMVDIYAVALVLEIRPACHKHRFDLLTKMTEQRPTLATLKYVHEHLPVDDVAVTRFITSYFEHRDKPQEYTDAELAEIEDYVCTVDSALHARFTEIGKSRQERAQVHRRRKAEARLQRIAEGESNGNGESGGPQFVGAETNGQQNGGAGRKQGGKKQNGEGNGKDCGSSGAE